MPERLACKLLPFIVIIVRSWPLSCFRLQHAYFISLRARRSTSFEPWNSYPPWTSFPLPPCTVASASDRDRLNGT
jgi:hypothetical protein